MKESSSASPRATPVEAQTISSPGVSEKVITVGAYDDNDTASNEDDTVASFSSRARRCTEKRSLTFLRPGSISYLSVLRVHTLTNYRNQTV